MIMAQPEVVTVAAVSNLGLTWESTWQSILRRERSSQSSNLFGIEFNLGTQVAGVVGLDRAVTPNGFGAATRLGRLVTEQLPPMDDDVRCYGATNHSEADILALLSSDAAAPISLWQALLTDPLPSHLLQGRAIWSYSACTSSLHALFAAIMDFSEDPEGSSAVVLGVDALSALEIAGFKRLDATAVGPCQPFSSPATGILIGEGAAAIRLRNPAQNFGSIRILGIGTSCDAFHPTDPVPTGKWLEQCIRDSISRSGYDPGDIAAIIAHGTGTAKNDAAEMSAYHGIWPRNVPPIISVKGAVGHTMGAAGLINVLVAIEVSRNGILPPFAEQASRPKAVPRGAPVLAVASGFGGNNCSCVVGTRR